MNNNNTMAPITHNALHTADTSSDDMSSDLSALNCRDGAGNERAYNHRISKRRFSCELDGAGHNRAYGHVISRRRAE